MQQRGPSMAQQVVGFAYWINALATKNGFPVRQELPRETRRMFRELARFLLDNEFGDIVQLPSAGDPAKWPGAEVGLLYANCFVSCDALMCEVFKQEDLEYIRKLSDKVVDQAHCERRSRSPTQ